MNQPPDVALVRRALGGDLAAFETLYTRHAESLLRTIQAVIQDRAAAEDILQECFVRAYRHLDRVDMQVESLAPWLHRIALNLAYSRLSRRRRLALPGLDFMANLLAPQRTHPDRLVEDAEMRNAVWEAIQSLDEKYRLVIVLYYLQEQSLSEIAERLALPVGTVKSRLYHARHHLREAMIDDRRLAHLIAYGIA